MAIADLDFGLIVKRKRMLDSVGHYSRPDLFELRVDKSPRLAIHSHPTKAPQELDEDFRLSNSRPVKEAVAAL